MPTSNAARQHVYRLALYGVRSSGKTCILSALSIPRVAHPEGLSCSWIENVPGHPLPSGDPSSWTTRDPYHIGWQWLSEQRKRLRSGDIPAPNPNRDPMRFLFDFGSPDHGTRHIELIDYSGELITASASELAATLREHMRECDGLLILAEAPRPNGDHTPLTDDLDKLAGAFRTLLNERGEAPRHEWPIAMLFNKWDRRTNANDEGDGDAADSLGEFLGQSPPPPHSALLDTIRNAVGIDNAYSFPVSAFGSHAIRDDGKEVPLLNDGRLQSFALEDGFVWVAQQCDALRVEQIETAADATSWWAFPQILLGKNDATLATESSAWTRWFRGVSAIAGVSSAWGFRQRLLKGSELRRRTTSALRAFGLKLASQVVVFVVLLMTLLIGGETIIDGVQYRTILATEKNPSANVEELKRGEDWLAFYFRSPGFRHVLSNRIVVGRSDAHRILVEFRTRRDNSLWQTVVDAEDPQTRVILARKYRDVFPSGLHCSEVDTLVADADRQDWERKNNEYLDQIAIKVDAVEPKPDAPLKHLHALSEEVDIIPFPEARSQATNNRQKELRGLIAAKQTRIVEASKQADWHTFQQTYVSLMQNKNIREAAKCLDGRLPQDAQLQELLDDFTKRSPAIIQANVRNALKTHIWQRARESARIVADPNVVRLFPADTIKSLQGLGREIDEAEDRDLYKQIVRYKPQCEDQVNAYLSRAPLKSMEKEVKEYDAYLKKKSGQLDLSLRLSAIQWHDKYEGTIYSYVSDITVQVKGEPLIAASGIKSEPNTRSADLGSGSFTAGLNDNISIDVSIVAKYGVVFTSTMSGGSGNWSGTPNQLRSGVTVPVKGDGFTNNASFSLSGIPEPPPLPNWKSR
jgi:hypothetical protein